MSAATAVVWVLVAALVSAAGAVNRTSLLNTTPANSTMHVVAAERTPQVGGWTPPMRGGAALVKPVESEKVMASTKDHARRDSIDSHAKQQRQPTSGLTSTVGVSVTRGSEDDRGGHSTDTDTMTTTTTAPGGHGEARVSLKGMSSEGVVVLAIMCLVLTMVRAHMCLSMHTHTKIQSVSHRALVHWASTVPPSD
jgi:hypothetical protein